MTGEPKLHRARDLAFSPRFAYGDQAKVAVVSGADGETALGTGFVRLVAAEIPWTVQYDEVVYVIEGVFTVLTGAGDLVAEAGDSIWLPKGTDLTYVAEAALLFYAIHPANWAEA